VSPRENAERAIELSALIEATDIPREDIAKMLNMTKSAVTHKAAGRRPVLASELAAVREHLALLGAKCYRVDFSLEGSSEYQRHFIEAVSPAAALRVLAVKFENAADTPNLESSP
jgi:hypothetical protein